MSLFKVVNKKNFWTVGQTNQDTQRGFRKTLMDFFLHFTDKNIIGRLINKEHNQ